METHSLTVWPCSPETPRLMQHIHATHPSSPSWSISLPSCPPGSRCSRSCPPPQWRPLLHARPGVSVGRLDARRLRPRCLEDTAGTFITFTTHFSHNTRRPGLTGGPMWDEAASDGNTSIELRKLHISPNYHDCYWAVYIFHQ